MKFYLNGPLNLQINETKKWQNASTEDRKRQKSLFFNKNQDRSELIVIEIQSFQIEKAPNGGPYKDT